ncbi:hypothetical protein BF95_16785, partial [Sphingobium sp. Ant17]
MTAPGVGPITAMAVTAAFDDAERFNRSSSAGAYLGLTPKALRIWRNQPERAHLEKAVTGSLENACTKQQMRSCLESLASLACVSGH